jgi:hypothetical protein
MIEPLPGLVLGLSIAVLLTACRPWGPERSVLARHAPGLRWRLLVPTRRWRDGLGRVDELGLRSLRRRAMASWATLVVGAAVAAFLATRDEDARRVARPERPAAQAPPELAVEMPAPLRTEPGPAPPETPPPEVLEELRTPARLYGTARVKPVYRVHDVEGARITNIDSTSFWALLGVREGDVVIEVAGDPVDSPADLVALMNGLERDEDVALAVRGVDGEVRYLEFRDPHARHR